MLRQNRKFILVMAAGSILGAFIGSRLLGIIPTTLLLPVLAIILLVSAVKVWRYSHKPTWVLPKLTGN